MANRGNYLNENKEENIIEHDDGFSKLGISVEPKSSKVVVIDADSLSYICSYQPKNDVDGNPTVYYTKENGGYEIVEGFLTEKLLGIYNKIEQYFNISNIYLCVKGKNNPRHKWLDNYKAHRPETPEIVKHLHSYLINHHAAYIAPIGEADDVIYSISKTIGNTGIICGIDKDLKIIEGIHFNYSKNTWDYITYKQSRFNFWKQVLTGDSSDFRGTSPGIGEKYALKVLNPEFSEEEYKEVVFQGFLKAWKGDEELAKKNMELAYDLVKLWDIEELKNK
jgi:5'-3' exonuclease